MLEKGLVQIYTGDGKGKTTAAFGLALRAAGQGNKVLIYQFLKPASLNIGERFALQPDDVKIRIEDQNTVSKMKEAIKEVLEQIAQAAQKRLYDCVILDEIAFCLSKGLVKLQDIKNIIDKRDPAVEIVLTGRGASKELIALADLVTEMKNIKHPFDKGTPARRGIEF